jgi:transposase-like protein
LIIETITHHCRDCDSKNIVKNGRNRYGNQQYLCKDCSSSRVLTPKKTRLKGQRTAAESSS